MTDYEIDNLWMHRTNIHDGDLMPQLRDFARAVLQAERETLLEYVENRPEPTFSVRRFGAHVRARSAT
jgi:hypothetical protein